MSIHKVIGRLLTLGVIAASTISFSPARAADGVAFEKNEKAYYLDEKELNFIRPGLRFDILQVWNDGNVAKMRFKITDRAGAPLDRDGIMTPGPVSVSAILAYMPADDDQYKAYTTRLASSSLTGMTATQASADSGGTFTQESDGVYVYTFKTQLPNGFDAAATHRVSAYASRNLSEFELGTDNAADTAEWVPNGSAVTRTREVVKDESCNACHGELTLHGRRTTIALCITCHQPQTVDPDTGNTMDFKVMVHKIHMGAELPSVQNGTPYQIIGNRNSVHDYSEVEFPADVRNCDKCHIQSAEVPVFQVQEEVTVRPIRSRGVRGVIAAALGEPAAEQEALLTENHHLLNPSREACGSCHDNVNFATGENHEGLPQLSDTQCKRCHVPKGELEYDGSILGSHTIERFSKEMPGINFEMISVSNTAPGQKPTLTFDIKNDAGQRVAPADMNRLALVMAGGNGVDFTGFVSENATAATGSGPYAYTFSQALPADATGRWAIGIEGYKNATILAGTQKQRGPIRDAGDNVLIYFDAGGGAATPRRTVVSQEKCDTCHFDLSLHGNNRNAVEHCVLCHNPTQTDAARRPADKGAAEGVNFKDMIHKIHTGADLVRDLTIYGFGGTPHNFNHVEFPNDRANCVVCHDGDSYQLPIVEGAVASVVPRDPISPAPPTTAACLSCHGELSVAAHADLNTSQTYGESCAVCHGPGSEFELDKMHAR